jgi:two-component system, cell cycle response regulator
MHRLSRLDKRKWIAGLIGLGWLLFALDTLGLFGDSASSLLGEWLYVALLAAAALACLWQAVDVPTERMAWSLMTAGIAAWALGEVAWSIDLTTAADALYLAFYPLAYATLVLLVRQQAGLASRDLWLDGAIGASCASAFAIAVALPAFGAVDGDTLELATALAYPVLDIVLLSFVIVVFGLSGWRPGRRWTLLGVGLAAMAVSDGAYLVATARGTYATGGLLDVGWTAAALLVAVAAWQPAATPTTPRNIDRRLVMVPVFCGLVALAVVTLAFFEALPSEAALPALLTLLLVTCRMGVAFVESQQTMDANRREALTDGLTGLGNRRALLSDLEWAVTRTTPEDPRVCILLDLDGFKAYNDAFGHPAGDELLARLGERLRKVVAGDGAAYRLGGDEFCVLARPGTGGARRLAEVARAALTETGEVFRVTSSAGLVEIPADAEAAAEVLQVADRRMYADKGRRDASANQQSTAALLRILREREPALHAQLVDDLIRRG